MPCLTNLNLKVRLFDKMTRWTRRCRYLWKLRMSRRDKDKLATANEATPLFTLAGKHCYGRVVTCPAPDQMEIAIMYQHKAQKFKCQLYQVNPNITIVFQNFFNTYRLVYLYCHDFSPDGKLLVDIYQTEHDYRIGGTTANDLIRVDTGEDPDFYV